LQTIVR